MERVLEVFESLNSQHQQVRNPASVQSEPTISVIQIDSELCSELLREEATEEAAVKVIVQYHEYREQSNHRLEFFLFAQPVVRRNCANDSGELFDALWTIPLSRYIALGKVSNELIISACRDIFAQERCLDFQDCSRGPRDHMRVDLEFSGSTGA